MARDREERFKKLAEGRMSKLLHDVKLIGNLSDKSNYKYTEEQVEEIFTEIDEAIDSCRNKFLEQCV